MEMCFKMKVILVQFLYKNHAENVQQKLVPDLFKVLVNSLKHPLHARHYFKSKVI